MKKFKVRPFCVTVRTFAGDVYLTTVAYDEKQVRKKIRRILKNDPDNRFSRIRKCEVIK